jgi:acyl carrier protein
MMTRTKEPTDVRDAAITHSDVEDAVAAVVDGELVLAVVPRMYASAVDIRDYVWRAVGDDNAPALVALVPVLPADIDALREAIPTLEPTQVSRYVEARDELERQLRDIVAEAVQAPRVGALDDFIDLGGDSLSAVTLSTLVHERLGADLLLENVFEASTVRGIAEAVRRQAG